MLSRLLDRTETTLTAHRRAVLVAVALSAALLRLVYFVQLVDGPFVDQHRWANSDMHFFDHWARVVSSGDWLTDRNLHPLHEWHEAIAEEHFRLQPPERPRHLDAGARTGDSAARSLWNEWYAGRRFHQEPLYPYLVAATYAVCGPDVRWVFGWQLLLGVVTTLLVHAAGRRLFGELAGLLAAVFALLYGPMMFYELVLLRTTLIACFSMVLLHLMLWSLRRPKGERWLVTGFVFGLALLLKTSFVLILCGFLAGVLAIHRRAPGIALRAALAVLLGVSAALAPVVARNMAVGASPLGLSSVGAITYLNSNIDGYPVDEGFYADLNGSARIMAATGGRFLPTVIATLSTHGGPMSYLGQLWRKLGKMVHWYEHPNSANFYFYRAHTSALRLAFVSFVLLGPLAIVGLLVGVPRLARAWPLYVAAGGLAAPLVLFYTLSRFRVPLAVVLMPFAALTVVELLGRLSARRFGAAAGMLAGVGILVLWVSRPLPADVPPIRFADYIQPYNLHFYDRMVRAQERGDWAGVRDVLTEALDYAPSFVRRGEETLEPGSERQRLASWYGRVYRELAWAHSRLGDESAASSAGERAIDLDPAEPEYQYRRAVEAQQSGDYGRSLAYLQTVETVAPRYRDAPFLRAFALQMTYDLPAAIEAYRALLSVEPDRFQAEFNLAHALMTAGQCEQAVPHFERVLALQPSYTEVHLHLGHCFQELGDPDSARLHERLYSAGR